MTVIETVADGTPLVGLSRILEEAGLIRLQPVVARTSSRRRKP